jgi:DNA primase
VNRSRADASSPCSAHSTTTKIPLLLNPDEDLWFCFPCGEGGDGITLVMRVRGCGFTEAVQWINARA